MSIKPRFSPPVGKQFLRTDGFLRLVVHEDFDFAAVFVELHHVFAARSARRANFSVGRYGDELFNLAFYFRRFSKRASQFVCLFQSVRVFYVAFFLCAAHKNCSCVLKPKEIQRKPVLRFYRVEHFRQACGSDQNQSEFFYRKLIAHRSVQAVNHGFQLCAYSVEIKRRGNH